MAYQTLYLRWRPGDFDSLVGQEPVKKALSNAIATGRIAHAYLFTGPRGTGKTTTARILAKALNCETGPTDHPCGHCTNCLRIADGSSMDVQELDAASNRGVEDIKNLNKNADFAPVNCRYKVYIIDEAHMLTTEACNALLKTLEEPPEHVVFILATTEPQKILPTIHSRCQRFDFKPITSEDIVKHLRKVADGSDISVDDAALGLIAAASEGGMRDALSLLEQCSVMADFVTEETVRSVRGILGRETLRELVLAIGKRDIKSVLEMYDFLLQEGKDISQILAELSLYLRSLLLFKAVPSYDAVYVADTAENLAVAAELFVEERIVAAQEIIHNSMYELRQSSRSRITGEMCLYELCTSSGDSIKALMARIAELEKQLYLLQKGQIKVHNAVPAASKEAQPVRKQMAMEVQSVRTSEQKSEIAQTAPVSTKEIKKTTEAVANSVQQDALKAVEEPLPKEKAQPVRKKVQPETPVLAKAAATDTALSDAAVSDAAGSEADVRPGIIASYEPYGGEWAEGDELWQNTMEHLRRENKISVAACAENGRVLAFENNILTIGFKGKFLAERLQKDDYRKIVEDAALLVGRVPVRIQCVVDSGEKKPVAKKRKTAQNENGAVSNISENSVNKTDLSESTRKAMEVFGGDVHMLS